ncbi:MAG: hypothetical protein ACREU3_03575 [Steroidobacteraceae bacterium]
MIADYACSQGRNSMRPVTLAIEAPRERAPACPVEIVHTDQPSNDFASLVVALRDDPDSYLAGQSGFSPQPSGALISSRSCRTGASTSAGTPEPFTG